MTAKLIICCRVRCLRLFYPMTSVHHRVSVLILHPTKIQFFCSQESKTAIVCVFFFGRQETQHNIHGAGVCQPIIRILLTTMLFKTPLLLIVGLPYVWHVCFWWRAPSAAFAGIITESSDDTLQPALLTGSPPLYVRYSILLIRVWLWLLFWSCAITTKIRRVRYSASHK